MTANEDPNRHKPPTAWCGRPGLIGHQSAIQQTMFQLSTEGVRFRNTHGREFWITRSRPGTTGFPPCRAGQRIERKALRVVKQTNSKRSLLAVSIHLPGWNGCGEVTLPNLLPRTSHKHQAQQRANHRNRAAGFWNSHDQFCDSRTPSIAAACKFLDCPKMGWIERVYLDCGVISKSVP